MWHPLPTLLSGRIWDPSAVGLFFGILWDILLMRNLCHRWNVYCSTFDFCHVSGWNEVSCSSLVFPWHLIQRKTSPRVCRYLLNNSHILTNFLRIAELLFQPTPLGFSAKPPPAVRCDESRLGTDAISTDGAVSSRSSLGLLYIF